MEPNERFDEAAGKYGLPSYNQVHREFDLHLEEDSDILITLLHAVKERVQYYTKVLEELLQPEASTSAIHECKDFTNDDNKELYSLYTKLMIIDRKLLEQDITRDEAQGAEVFKVIWDEWTVVKDRMLGIVKKMRLSWNSQNKEEGHQEYFG